METTIMGYIGFRIRFQVSSILFGDTMVPNIE